MVVFLWEATRLEFIDGGFDIFSPLLFRLRVLTIFRPFFCWKRSDHRVYHWLVSN
jgi:hypothetical protein